MDSIGTMNKYNEFARLLVKTPLEPFTSELWKAFDAVATNALDFKNIINERKEKSREEAVYMVKLAKQLLALLNNQQVMIGRIKVNNPKILEALKKAYIDEYKAFHMDYRDMTFEEAKEELTNWRESPLAADWIVEECMIPEYDEGLSNKEFIRYNYDVMDRFCQDDWNVERYAALFSIKEEINPKQVEKNTKLTISKKTQGRKPKNYNLLWLILEIRKFYKERKNKDYRVIFDCMDLLGLLDKIKVDWEKKYDTDQKLNMAKASYIKSIYNEALKYERDNHQILLASYKEKGKDFHEA